MNPTKTRMCRFFSIFAFGVLGLFSVANSARAQIPGTETIASLFALDGEIAGYDGAKKALRFFVLSGADLKEIKTFSVESPVMAIVAVTDGYLYATGMNKDNLGAPIEVHKVAKDGSHHQIVFQQSGERNQVNRLIWDDGKVWIDFFESKYFTKIGYLVPDKAAPWKFTEVATLRMGDSLDVRGSTIAVGRSYGDEQGHDGDLRLLQDGQNTLLPSYRGVRGVKILSDNPQTPSIVIGDGWHQNYGQVAQARISLLKKRAGESRYALELIDRDQSNTDFSKFFEFTVEGRRYIAARGDATIVVYGPEGEWSKKDIYKQTDPNHIMDMALLQVDSHSASFAILDNGVRLVRFTP